MSIAELRASGAVIYLPEAGPLACRTCGSLKRDGSTLDPAYCSRRCAAIGMAGRPAAIHEQAVSLVAALRRRMDLATQAGPPYERICEYCGGEFEARRPEAKTCSARCRKALHVLRRSRRG